MKSKQTVCLNADKSKAVPFGSKEAAFILVREGGEISDTEAEKYPGAIDLIESEAAPIAPREVAPGERGAVQTREPAPTNRDPGAKPAKAAKPVKAKRG